MIKNMKKAFSLIELLIVILIVGVVYTLSVGSFKKANDETKKLSLENLKEYLQEMPHDDSVEYLCLDDCTSCNIIIDGEKVNEEPIKGFLDKDVKIYKYDFYSGINEQSKKVYFNSEGVEEDLCFSYSVDKKGIGNQVIVDFKDKIYDFSVYLSAPTVYNSLEELIDAKESLAQEVLR